MSGSIHDVLLALGAKAGRDAQRLALDLSLLDMQSVFGGDLAGEAVVEVSSPEAFAFEAPPELAACGTLWLPGVETAEALLTAVVEAHDAMRARLDDDMETLKRLGLKARLVAPEPRARARTSVAGRALQVAIDPNGDLVLESADGHEIPAEMARAVSAPDDADAEQVGKKLAQLLERLEASGLLSSSESFDVDVDMADDGDGEWQDEGSVTTQGDNGNKTGNATRNLSDEQLAELHAALGDSDDDDDVDELIDASDEADPIEDEPEIAEGDAVEPTLSVPAVESAPPIAADGDDDEPRTATYSSPRKPSSLLAALDGGGEAADAGGDAPTGDDAPVDAEEEEDETGGYDTPVAGSEGDAGDEAEVVSEDDELGDAEIAADVLAAAARDDGAIEPGTLQSPLDAEDAPPPVSSEEEHDAYDEPTVSAMSLLAAQDTHQTMPRASQARVTAPFEPPPRPQLRVDDFPALPADADENEPAPTSVNTPDEPLVPPTSMPSSAPTMTLKPTRTSDEDLESIARGFDDGEGFESRPSGPRTMEAEEEPATHVPTRGTVSISAEDEDALPPPISAAEPGEDDDDLAVEETATAASPPPTPESAPPPPDDELSVDQDEVETRAVSLAGIRAASIHKRTDEELDGEDPDALEARAGALEEEARALRERAAELRERIAAQQAQQAHQAQQQQPPRPPTLIGATGEHGSASAASSLPVLASMEVEEVSDDEAFAAAGEDVDVDVDVDVAVAAPNAPPPPTRASDEGVSLADVRAALGDLVSLPGEATQVGGLQAGRFVDGRNSVANSADSDVFSTGTSDAPAPHTPSPASSTGAFDDHPPTGATVELEDSLEVAIGNGHAAQEKGGSGVVGLVVEDAKARDRLRKHLSPRVRELVEAADATQAAMLPDLDRIEALVLVRPRPDDATREGLEQVYESSQHPPRILIISSDHRFDDMPEVSLRLPLGQRASEVAQQVVDGLRSLGVECVEGADVE